MTEELENTKEKLYVIIIFQKELRIKISIKILVDFKDCNKLDYIK